MAVRIVQLGSPRTADEGLRIGTVRRPPRGIKKTEYASRDIFDVWFPNLSPSEALLKEHFPVADEKEWKVFARKFKAEMKQPDKQKDLELLAAMSAATNFSIGCYCEDENRCHRSLLEEMLSRKGATLV